MANINGDTLKNIGVGGGGAAVLIALLMSFQNQGVDRINTSSTMTQVNSKRIDKLEATQVKLMEKISSIETRMTEKMEQGFENTRNLMTSEMAKINAIVIKTSSDRYTKEEHRFYSDTVNERFDRLREDIKELREKYNKKK